MIGVEAIAKDGSEVIVTRTKPEQVNKLARCCKRPFLPTGFVVGDRHAECVIYPSPYDAATTAIVELERAHPSGTNGPWWR